MLLCTGGGRCARCATPCWLVLVSLTDPPFPNRVCRQCTRSPLMACSPSKACTAGSLLLAVSMLACFHVLQCSVCSQVCNAKPAHTADLHGQTMSVCLVVCPVSLSVCLLVCYFCPVGALHKQSPLQAARHGDLNMIVHDVSHVCSADLGIHSGSYTSSTNLHFVAFLQHILQLLLQVFQSLTAPSRAISTPGDALDAARSPDLIYRG